MCPANPFSSASIWCNDSFTKERWVWSSPSGRSIRISIISGYVLGSGSMRQNNPRSYCVPTIDHFVGEVRHVPFGRFHAEELDHSMAILFRCNRYLPSKNRQKVQHGKFPPLKASAASASLSISDFRFKIFSAIYSAKSKVPAALIGFFNREFPEDLHRIG